LKTLFITPQTHAPSLTAPQIQTVFGIVTGMMKFASEIPLQAFARILDRGDATHHRWFSSIDMQGLEWPGASGIFGHLCGKPVPSTRGRRN